MSEINFHEFTDSLTATFRRYLFTTNLVADSEPGLRQAIFEELSRSNVFARQPLITCIPAYKLSLAAAELMRRESAPCLSPSLSRFTPQEFDLARRLYEHQIAALDKAQQGRNLIVATGTGSGKTECFLLPVLDDAAQNPGDGVRAIVVYPMNALANDQLGRLRRLLAPIQEITFGRYTGDTPWTRENLSEEDARQIAPNECWSREEIRQNPPHILLTNFAMLEYLLLRPGDADIFRHQRLRYVVLDEAHTYTGAQGIDVALLMRRLQETFRDAPMQFILTSATLTEGQSDEARARVARFGCQLTGARFEPDDVIFGATTTAIAENGQAVTPSQIVSAVPNEQSLQRWLAAIEDAAQLRGLIAQSGLPNNDKATNQPNVSTMLYHLLRDWQPLRRIHEAISERSRDFSELTKLLWDEDSADNQRALQWLMLMAAYAREHAESSPLLPVRFHHFFRGLNGATICLNPGCDKRHPLAARWSRVFLEDRTRCDEPCGKLLWPLSTCFLCGMPAVAAWVSESEQKLFALRPSREINCARLVMTWDDAVAESNDEEEGANEQDVDLCLACGRFREGERLADCCNEATIVTLRQLATNNGVLKQCPRCGGAARPFDSVLRDFRSGEDATTAVIAEAMMRKLPAESRNADKLPAGGRRMLAFSDSRQRAAFFAPYLKRTTGETEYLKPLYEAVCAAERANDGDPVTLEDIAKRFVREAMQRPLVWLRTQDEEDSDIIKYKWKLTRELLPNEKGQLRRQAYIDLLKHFCASPRQRLNLPGLGLAAAEASFSDGNHEDIPNMLPEVFADGIEVGFDFLQQLLQIFLLRRVLRFEDDAITIRDIGLGPQQATFHRSLNDRLNGRQRYRWNPYAANNRRQRTIQTSFTANLVARFFGLDLQQDGEKIDEHLNKIWDCLRQTALYETAHAGEYQIDAERLVVTTKRPWYRCDRCGRLSVFNIKGLCAAPLCAGRTQAFSADEMESFFSEHHYRRRLTELEPLALNVAEHTAQLTNKLGGQYQKEFVAGRINVLSSSTTFEMGVDVGALKAVLLRNVPPAASNYIQRAGRAGRRREGAAYAVTYCRNMPHDQYHFHRPEEIVGGKIALPMINLQNRRLAQRHINSFLLGQFLRARHGDGEKLTVAEFFLNPTPAESPASRFEPFVETEAQRLRQAIERILPRETDLEVDACLETSRTMLYSTNPECVYEREVHAPRESYLHELRELQTQQQSAAGAQLTAIGRAQTAVQHLIRQLEEERLIDFLAGCNWLPGYAFPQDVVRLLVRQPNWADRMRLERDRESGISEYAPGSEVIADGHLFKSAAVVKRGQAFKVKQYQYCPNCRQLETALEHENPGRVCQCSNQSRQAMKRKYIEPQGFQTLFGDPVPEPNLYRLRPPSNTELFLVAGARPDEFQPHAQVAGVSYGHCPKGKLFRANPGHRYEQFRLCKECGRYIDKQLAPHSHQTPWGTSCSGTLFKIDLAHEFTTDTLQLRFDRGTLNPPDISDQVFWLSLQTAFTFAAAEVMVIPRSDLDGTYRSQTNESLEGELVIYDRVPGGAGYVERIIESLPAILRRTLEKTGHCDNPLCDLNGSCYACLRGYANQFRWDMLRRRVVSEWLERFIR